MIRTVVIVSLLLACSETRTIRASGGTEIALLNCYTGKMRSCPAYSGVAESASNGHDVCAEEALEWCRRLCPRDNDSACPDIDEVPFDPEAAPRAREEAHRREATRREAERRTEAELRKKETPEQTCHRVCGERSGGDVCRFSLCQAECNPALRGAPTPECAR